MASNKLSAILKSRSTYSITLSVLVSFLFVFAFATSTTTLSSTGITATGSGEFSNLGVGTTTDPLYGLKAARQEWYFDVKNGQTEDHVVLDTNSGFRFWMHDTSNNPTSYMGIWDREVWLQTYNVASGTTASIGVQAFDDVSLGLNRFEGSAGDNSGVVVGANFNYDFSALDQLTDSYTALKLNVVDTASLNVTQKTLMDLQVSGNSRFKVSNMQDAATVDGPDLVVDGDFGTDPTGIWNFTGGWSWNTDHAENNGGGGNMSQTLSINTGDTYLVTYTVSNLTTGDVQASLGGVDRGYGKSFNQTYREIVTAVNTSDLIFTAFAGFDGRIDNVSVQKITLSSPILTLSNTGLDILPFRLAGGSRIAIGTDAGQFMGSPDINDTLIFGHRAGQYLAYGGYNTFLGNNSGSSFQSGDNNTLLGDRSGEALLSGNDNTFLGQGAGADLVSGNHNTLIGSGIANGNANASFDADAFLGYQSGYSNYTGASSTFIGYQSGFSNTTGSQNFFGGYQAGYNNTTISDLTFLGYQAGYSNTIGDHNTFIGNKTGYSNTTGNNNDFFGFGAGENNTTGNQNVFLGDWAGHANRTGQYNTYVGNGSSNGANMHGSDNTYLGVNTGENSLGSDNIFVGAWVGQQSLGSRLTFVGSEAGSSNSYGTGDTGVGYQALKLLNPSYQSAGAITTFADSSIEPGTKTKVSADGHGLSNGQEIVINETTNYNGVWLVSNVDTVANPDTFDIEIPFIADDSGNWYILIPTNNTAIGYQAGYGNVDGSRNVFNGYQSGYYGSGLDSKENVFIGYQAGYGSSTNPLNTSGNVFVGYQSGYSAAGGNTYENAALGAHSLYNLNNGNENTSLGDYSGESLVDGNLNVFIGYNSGHENRNGSNNVFLGYGAGQNEIGSNRLYIANNGQEGTVSTASSTALIYGEFDNGLLRINGLLDVSSSTATSTFAGNLDVAGNIEAAVMYPGDLIFANAFKFYEDPKPVNGQLADGTQSLKLTNQNNEDIFSIDDQGNLTIKGKLTQASSTQDSVISLGLSWILDQFKTIGVTIADGVISAKEFIADKVTGDEIKANQQICVGSRCITESQFNELLDKNGIGQTAAPLQAGIPVDNVGASQEDPTIVAESTTTPEVTPEPALSDNPPATPAVDAPSANSLI